MTDSRGSIGGNEVWNMEETLRLLDTEELRDVVGTLLLELEGAPRERVRNLVMHRAARGRKGLPRGGPDDEGVAEALRFVEEAERVGYAEPRAVDALLSRAVRAFLRADYLAARRMYGALLPKLGGCEITVGRHEALDEVLAADTYECGVQYVVAVYMTTDSEERAPALVEALEDVRELASLCTPVAEMEKVAIEPLPHLDRFLPRWRAHLEELERTERDDDLTRERRAWLREAASRLGGADGIAALARSTTNAEDLKAWCDALVASGDWEGVLRAYGEAAELTSSEKYWRALFLDGAALAASELGRRDARARLERAWLAEPDLARLCRWLASAKTRSGVRRLARRALSTCPAKHACLRGFLHLLCGDFDAVARLLRSAPGLGWSRPDHPGHLLFGLLAELLAEDATRDRVVRLLRMPAELGLLDELRPVTRTSALRNAETPSPSSLLQIAGPSRPIRDPAHSLLLAALSRAAEKRVEGVTRGKRRRVYAHAARLVAVCTMLAPTPARDRWLEELRGRYSRYPALQAELRRWLARAEPRSAGAPAAGWTTRGRHRRRQP